MNEQQHQPLLERCSRCAAPLYTHARVPTPHGFTYRTSLSLTAAGTSVSYLDTVHHRAPLEGLAPGTRFFYRCGNPSFHPSYAAAAGASAATGTGTGSPALDMTVVGDGGGGRNGLSIVGEDGDAGGVGVGLESQGPSSSETAAAATPGVRGARGGGDGGGGAVELRDAGKWSSVFSFVTAPAAERWVKNSVGACRLKKPSHYSIGC